MAQAPVPEKARGSAPSPPSSERAPDLSEVVGQTMARRALEVAAAGCHAMLLVEKGSCLHGICGP